MQKVRREHMEIKGQVERITYANEEDGYVIAKVKVPGRHDLVTVVGNLFTITPGELLRLTGHWQQHPKYGEQFRVYAYETMLPATIKGIAHLLLNEPPSLPAPRRNSTN